VQLVKLRWSSALPKSTCGSPESEEVLACFSPVLTGNPSSPLRGRGSPATVPPIHQHRQNHRPDLFDALRWQAYNDPAHGERGETGPKASGYVMLLQDCTLYMLNHRGGGETRTAYFHQGTNFAQSTFYFTRLCPPPFACPVPPPVHSLRVAAQDKNKNKSPKPLCVCTKTSVARAQVPSLPYKRQPPRRHCPTEACPNSASIARGAPNPGSGPHPRDPIPRPAVMMPSDPLPVVFSL
jgi:hypothetical protein